MATVVRIRSLVLVALLCLTLLPRESSDFRKIVHIQLREEKDVTSFPVPPSNVNLNVVLTTEERDLNISIGPFIFGGGCNSQGHHPVWRSDQERFPTMSSRINVIKHFESLVGNSPETIKMSLTLPCNNLQMIPSVLHVLRQRLKSLPFVEGQHCVEVARLSVVSEFGDCKGVSSGDVTLHAVMQLSTSSLIPSMCRHSMWKTDSIENNPAHQLPLPAPDITIFLQVHFTSVLYSSQPSSCVVHLPRKVESSPKHDTLSTVNKPKCAEPESPETSPTPPTGKRFNEYPFWSRLFAFNILDPFSRQDGEKQKDHTDLTPFALVPFIREILFSLMVLMTIIYRHLSQSLRADKTKNDDRNSVYLKVLTKSFFLKWTWHRAGDSPSVAEPVKRDADQDSQSAGWKLSPFNVLNSFIFRPWLTKASSRQCQPCPSNSCSSTSPLFSSCHRHLQNATTSPNHTFEVYPAFLPNPTRNPSLDLAHVGYRLATLGVLSASFPVSRIKLADAGFYFQGNEDEMKCYSCGTGHSGWRRGDSPMDIHRHLSPACQHVVHRDQELSSTASLSPATVTGQTLMTTSQHTLDNSHASCNGHSPGTQAGNINGLAEETHLPHSPEEDSCDSEPSSMTSSGLQGPSTPANAAACAGGTREAHEHHGSSPINSSSTPSTLASSSSPTAGSVQAESRSRHPEEGQSGTATPNTTTRPTTGSEVRRSSDDQRMPQLSSSTSATLSRSRATAVPPSDGPSDGQNEVAARADSRRLFPTARLDLGGAVYPMYQNMAARRTTFSRWDNSQAPPLEEVLLSGMFYAGYADCVRCFYCGVGLKNWEVTDNVWDEHVRWRPECGYLRTVKGEHFIRDAQRRLDTEDSTSSQGAGGPPPPGTGNGRPPTSAPAQRHHSASSTPPGSTAPPSGTAVPARSSRSSTVSPVSASSGGPAGSAAAAGTCGVTSSASSPLREALRGQEAETGSSGRVVVSNASGNAQSAERLREENQDLVRRLQCTVCRRAPIDTILMPCGHLVICESCAGSVTSCPLCQDRIMATAKVHFPE